MIKVTLIPILDDNYAYLLEGEDGALAVVDPGESEPIVKVLEERNLTLDMVLITHHHGDHTGGVKDLVSRFSCRVVGPAAEVEKIGALDVLLDEGSDFSFGGERVRIIETAGHTAGHICFYFADSGVLFSGDTLFAMGCGRLFEGSPAEMHRSLQRLAALPDETEVYCGHEYTVSNAQFCIGQAQENVALQARLKSVQDLRNNNIPTIPFTLKEEKETNLFLMAGDVDEFARLRVLKDRG